MTNYKGVRPATLVKVLEGDGSVEHPFEQVDYVIVNELEGGRTRPVTIGKVISVNLNPNEEKTT